MVNGKLFPVSYASRKLLDREKNYPICEKECLAIVWGIQKFKKYLFGNGFLIETDHQALKYLEKNKFTNSRLMRWALLLQEYNMEINFINGSENYGADFLSRF